MGFASYQVASERRGLERDLQRQALNLAESQAKAVEPLISAHSYHELQRQMDRFKDRERLMGMAIYDPDGQLLAVTSGLSPRLKELLPAASDGAQAQFVHLEGAPIHVAAIPVKVGPSAIGTLAIFHDAAYISTRVNEAWRRALVSVTFQTLLIIVVTQLTIRSGLGQPLLRMAQWLKELRTGQAAAVPQMPQGGEFEPFTHEVSRLASSFTAAKAAAEEEARLRDSADSHWTTDRLRVFVQGRLGSSRLVMVSNREPYEHFHGPSGIACSVPASGLVTAIEPILRACDGTWIAQATGDADRETADQHGRLRVPPDHPRYSLRRLWLTPEEVQGFYLGFANEGLWPL
ncbi:MAG: trehalose-6-phosphate synthase, partial [Bryobacteraceae bacterium]